MNLKRVGGAVVTAAAAISGMFVLSPVSPATALPAGTAATGLITLTRPTGTSADSFNVQFGSVQTCPGNSDAGYYWNTFIAPRSVDPATLTWENGFPKDPNGDDNGAKTLRNLSNNIKNQLPAIDNYQITPPNNVTFSSGGYSTLSGEYRMGIACVKADIDSGITQTERYWSTPITITPGGSDDYNNFTYAVGMTPNAPTLGTLTPAEGQVSVAFTPAAKIAGNPEDTGYTVVVKDSSCTAGVTSQSGAGSPITVTGLANGTTYCFSVKASNSFGDGAASTTSTAAAVAPLAATPGNKSVVLSWSAGTWSALAPLTDYAVEYRRNGTGVWKSAKTKAITATTFTVTGLTNGLDYEFRVAGKKASTTGSYLTVGPVIPRTVPGKVRSFKAVARNTSVSLTWAAPASNGGSLLTDYVIEYSSNGGTSWSTVSDGVSTNTSYTVTGLVNAIAYKVRVSAQNIAGIGAAVTTAKAVKPYLSAPTAPQSVKATPRNVSVVVTWKAPKDDGGSVITDYRIEWTVDGLSWSSANAGTALTYTIPGLVNGTGYKVRVSATNTVFFGYGKTAGTAKAVKPYLVLPGKVGSLKATAASASLNLTWKAPTKDGGSEITDYLIEYSSNGGTSWSTVSDGVSTATTYQITGLVAGTAYKVRVSAINVLGTGPALTTAKPAKPLA